MITKITKTPPIPTILLNKIKAKRQMFISLGIIIPLMSFFISYNLYKAYKIARDPIYLTIATKQEIKHQSKYFQKGQSRRITEFDRHGNQWSFDKGHVVKIWISYPKGLSKNIEEIRINIGNKLFRFSEKDLSKFKTVYVPMLKNFDGNNEIIEAPEFVRSTDKSPLLLRLIARDSINWRRGYLLDIFIDFILLLFFTYILAIKAYELLYAGRTKINK